MMRSGRNWLVALTNSALQYLMSVGSKYMSEFRMDYATNLHHNLIEPLADETTTSKNTISDSPPPASRLAREHFPLVEKMITSYHSLSAGWFTAVT